MIAKSSEKNEDTFVANVANQLLRQISSSQKQELRGLAGGDDALLAAAKTIAVSYITDEKGLGQQDMGAAIRWAENLGRAGVSNIVPFDPNLDETFVQPLKTQLADKSRVAQKGA